MPSTKINLLILYKAFINTITANSIGMNESHFLPIISWFCILPLHSFEPHCSYQWYNPALKKTENNFIIRTIRRSNKQVKKQLITITSSSRVIMATVTSTSWSARSARTTTITTAITTTMMSFSNHKSEWNKKTFLVDSGLLLVLFYDSNYRMFYDYLYNSNEITNNTYALFPWIHIHSCQPIS